MPAATTVSILLPSNQFERSVQILYSKTTRAFVCSPNAGVDKELTGLAVQLGTSSDFGWLCPAAQIRYTCSKLHGHWR